MDSVTAMVRLNRHRRRTLSTRDRISPILLKRSLGIPKSELKPTLYQQKRGERMMWLELISTIRLFIFSPVILHLQQSWLVRACGMMGVSLVHILVYLWNRRFLGVGHFSSLHAYRHLAIPRMRSPYWTEYSIVFRTLHSTWSGTGGKAIMIRRRCATYKAKGLSLS